MLPKWGCLVAESSLHAMIARRDREPVLFGLTPPRRSSAPEDVSRIADRTAERIRLLDVDGIVLYDIDDESDRIEAERPFPYLPTLDPADYAGELAGRTSLPTVVYRSVGKYAADELHGWLTGQRAEQTLTVFVGASSPDKDVRLSLARAQEVWREAGVGIPLGGVTIPERHARGGDEHERLLHKQERGCTFFISQVVYDVTEAKDLVSDYAYTCRERGIDPVPVIFTLSVCGSAKTLEFLSWLGVDVPRWLQNDLRHSDDPLEVSLRQCTATVEELIGFCRRLGVPFGFNIESVSNRRVEIEASMELTRQVRALLPQR